MREREPNRPLAWERLQRGWSYEEVAERVRAEMARSHETDTGLTANTVRRWETGERRPDPRYRKHLVTIMGKPASELGLLTPDEMRMRPESPTSEDMRRLLGMIGSDGGGLHRSTVLRGLLTAGALPILAPILSLEEERVAAKKRVVDPDTYVMITDCHRKLYWASPARPLYEAAYAHTQLGIELLRGTCGPSRATLGSALAESALLTARLALFDLHSAAVAERCFDVALTATREGGDHGLAAVVLGHMAFGRIFGPVPSDARAFLNAALQHTWHEVNPLVRSWLHCVASEAESRAGNPVVARREIELATRSFEPSAPRPAWLDFYDGVRLQCFAGYAALSAGDDADAVTHLGDALAGLGDNDGKQRIVVLADLARANRGDVTRSADFLAQAVDALSTEWYVTGFDRVREVRPVLRDSAEARELDQRVEALIEAGGLAPVGL